jgi:hypothetical protein
VDKGKKLGVTAEVVKNLVSIFWMDKE